MFWRRYDPYYDRSSGCGCIIGIIVLALIIALLVAFLYIGSIVLMIACGIGLIIGLVYSIKTYIKALIDAGKSVFGVNNRKFTILQYLKFMLKTFRLAFSENLAISKNAYFKSRQFKTFSLKKWAWLVASLSTVIFGTLLLLLCIAGHLIICLMLLTILLQIVLLVLSIPTVCYSLYTVFKGFAKALATDNPWKIKLRQSNAKDYSKKYFSKLFDTVRTVWNDNIQSMRSNIAKSHSLGFLNIKKYVLVLSPCVMIVAELALLSIMFVVYAIAYPPLLLINSFKKP